ncbi:MAG: Squalene--hopene cyclase [Verrucomicrobiales bacterium]|nr:Squalene--hopene cyclase [Verrucomicrobiales bacterium]
MNTFEEPLQSVLDRIIAQRGPDGWWDSAMEGGPIHASLSLLATTSFCSPSHTLAQDDRELVSSLLTAQNDVGAFPAYSAGPASYFATRIAIEALENFQRVEPANDSTAQSGSLQLAINRAKEFLQSGDPRGESFLHRQTALLVEAAFSGKKIAPVRFHLYALVTFLFLTHWLFKPLRLISSAAFQQILPAAAILLQNNSRNAPLTRLIDRFLRLLHIRSAEQFNEALAKIMCETQSANGSWGWTVLATSISLIALHTRGHDADSPPVLKGISYLRALRRRDNEGHLIQSWGGCRVWDTANVADLLAIPCFERHYLMSGDIARLLSGEQGANGLMPFDRTMALQDHDSSAVYLNFLAKAYALGLGAKQPWVGNAVEVCVLGLLADQHKDGGWGFAKCDWAFATGSKPPSELLNMISDVSTPDMTGRCLLALMAARQSGALSVSTLDAVDVSICNAREYLLQSQARDGSWWSRWLPEKAGGTSLSLLALRITGSNPDAVHLKRGREWIISFGTTKEALGAGSRSLGQTDQAFCALGLLATTPNERIEGDEPLRKALSNFTTQSVDATDASLPVFPFVPRHEYYSAPLYTSVLTAFTLVFYRTALKCGICVAMEECLWGRTREKRKPVPQRTAIELVEAYDRFRKKGIFFAGSPEDIAQRVVVHYTVYRGSGRNFTFPLLALHGAAWAHGYFNFLSIFVGPYCVIRHPFSYEKRRALRASLEKAMLGFRMANQRVLSDTYANYHFTKQFGTCPGAEKIVKEPLLSFLNRIHSASERNLPMSNREKRETYSENFQWEQANSVWPTVARTVRELRDPIAKFIAFRPLVAFAYFPTFTFLFFKDFSKTDERIEQGWKAYQIAEEMGWAHTERSMGSYRFLPLDYLENFRWLDQRAEEFLHEPQKHREALRQMPWLRPKLGRRRRGTRPTSFS